MTCDFGATVDDCNSINTSFDLELWSVLIVAIVGGVFGLVMAAYIAFGRVLGAKMPQEGDKKKIAQTFREVGNAEIQALAKEDHSVDQHIKEFAEIIDEMPAGDDKNRLNKNLDDLRANTMTNLAKEIQSGAKAFLGQEYKLLAVFVVIMSVVVGFAAVRNDAGCANTNTCKTFDYKTLLGFIIGAVLSGACGWLGMWMAVQANVRTAQACWKDPEDSTKEGSLNAGLQVSFGSGAVMGLSVVSSGILGLCLMVGAFIQIDSTTTTTTDNNGVTVSVDSWKYWSQSTTSYLAGFGFGASAIALFARVGGGIYTKAADVGADLVGKVEAGIPEDDPRNPATIADNVGDNVGDVAGMGADLFESFVGSIIASVQLAPRIMDGTNITGGVPNSQIAYQRDIAALVALPFWMAGFGILSSIVGIFLVRTTEDSEDVKNSENYADHLQEKLLTTINRGIQAAALLSCITTYITTGLFFGFDQQITYQLWGCTVVGLVAGIFIGAFTEYATSFAHKPTQSIAKKSRFGHAGSIIQGLGIGMISTVVPVVILVIAIIVCYTLGNVYGIAIAAVGMLSTLGVTLATDAFGPVADNAGGIAEMAELPERVRDTTDGLDSLGNTTAASGKGFAIGSAILTSLALLAAFKTDAGVDAIDVSKATVLSATLLGACLPYIFGALTMMAVGRSAAMMIDEVRTQFKELNLLGTDPNRPIGRPDSAACVAISTKASLIEMLIPGILAIVAPLFVGYLLDAEALGGMLVGCITSGCMLAIYMSNAGGAWDNAKKWIEAGGLEKAYGKTKAQAGKGSDWHKAAVTGDTVGDPFKDTSGPALNILIKLMTMIALVFGNSFKDAATFANWYVALIIFVAFFAILIGFQCWARKTGFGKIDFDKLDTPDDEEKTNEV